MDGFMPHIALQVRSEVLELAGPGIKQRFTSLYVKNIGVGFAQQVGVRNDNLPRGNLFDKGVAPAALGVGEEVRLIAKDAADHETIMAVIVTYADAFGRQFETSMPNDITLASKYTWRRL